jgi:hypothetical protein
VDERYELSQEPDLPLLGYGLAKVFWAVAVSVAQSFIYVMVSRMTVRSFQLPVLLGWALFFVVALGGALLALLISAAVKTPTGALAVFPLVLIPQILFGGFVMPTASLRPFRVVDVVDHREVLDLDLRFVRNPGGSAIQLGAQLSLARWAWECGSHMAVKELASPKHNEQGLKTKEEDLKTIVRFVSLVPTSVNSNPSIVLDAARQAAIAETLDSLDQEIPNYSTRYFLRLMAYLAIEGGLFFLLLSWRDPRRV